MSSRLRIIAVVAGGALALMLASFTGSAVAKDRNNDRIPDKWEKRFHLSLSVDQANKDQDRDHVDNLNEFQEGTNPRMRDSNHNGRPDGREDADHDGLNNAGEDQTANLPNDQDTDNDGVEDGAENAGMIASFDGTTLVVDVAGGGQVSGTVDANTRIKCETEEEHEASDDSGAGTATASHDSGSGDQSSDDNSGPSDNQGPGNEGSLCGTADLTPGTAVHEAELQGSSFEEIELVK